MEVNFKRKGLRKKFNDYIANNYGIVGEILTTEVNTKTPATLGLAALTLLGGCDGLPNYKNPKNRDERLWNATNKAYSGLSDAMLKAKARDKRNRAGYEGALKRYNEDTAEIEKETENIRKLIKQIDDDKKAYEEGLKKAREKAGSRLPSNSTETENSVDDNDSDEDFVPVIIK